MYGHIHIILKDLITSSFGLEKWAQILKLSGLEEDQILEPVQQPDDVTFKLVGAICEVTELNLEEALEAFGRHFVSFTLKSGYVRLLKALGNTFPTFLANVNYLHNHLERQHPQALFPYIEVIYEDGQDSLDLHYLSTRPRMNKVLVGIVTEMGRQLFDLKVLMKEQPSPRYFRKDAADSAKRAASWRISWKAVDATDSSAASTSTAKMSFPDLHVAMMDFGKLLSTSFFDTCEFLHGPCCAHENCGVVECIEVPCAAETETEAERKFKEAQNSDCPEEVLLRATDVRSVAAGWVDDNMVACRDFWSSSVGTSANYAMSYDAEQVDVFVSHNWLQPPDWEEMMGPEVDYAEIKAASLAVMAKDFAHRKLQDWDQITFWVDKACIAQDHPQLKAMSIKHLDHFLAKCDSMCVLFSWTYLERLWCVYEWACVLIHKPTEKVYLQTELFVKEETLPLYLEAVRNFSLANTKCGFEEDRQVLQSKIDEAYVSKGHFEILVQATVIALMAQSMSFRAGRSPKLYATYFQPWVALARELGMDELATALESCDCLTWRRVSTISSDGEAVRIKKSSSSTNSGTETKDLLSPWSTRSQMRSPENQEGIMQMSIGVNSMLFHQVISDWFEIDVVPILAKYQQASLR